MRLLVGWTIVSALLLLTTHAGARDVPPAHAINEKKALEPVMSLVPGIYVTSDGYEDPNAFAVRISQVSGNQFKGTIELVRLGKSGEIVRETSELTGVLGKQKVTETFWPYHYESTGRAPLTMKLQNGSLQSRMSDFEGNMNSVGFSLFWKAPRNVFGSTHGWFVLTTEDAYQQILARYMAISSYKKRLLVEQTSSAKVMKGQLESYMETTSRWLGTAQGNELEMIRNKVRVLYAQETKALASSPADRAAAAMLANQIDAYASQAQYIRWTQEEQEHRPREAWVSADIAFEQSLCKGESAPGLRYDVLPECAGMPALFATAQQRSKQVDEELARRFHRATRLFEELGCFQAAGRAPLESNRGVPPSCKKFEMLSN